MENEQQQPPAVTGQPPAAAGNTDGLGADLDRLTAEASLTPEGGTAVQQLQQQQQQAAADELRETQAALSLLLQPTFDLLCPNWNVQAAECNALAGAYAPVLVKYFPGGIGKMGPELTAVLVTAAIFGPRIGVPRVKPEEKPKAAEGAAHG